MRLCDRGDVHALDGAADAEPPGKVAHELLVFFCVKPAELVEKALYEFLEVGRITNEAVSSPQKENQQRYKDQFLRNMSDAADEIDVYLKTKIDYDMHYNMVLSDVGAARSFIFLVEDEEWTDRQKTVNELHYCLVKYPDQMKNKLEDVSNALKDVYDNLDKGYDEMSAIVDSVDKMGS